MANQFSNAKRQVANNTEIGSNTWLVWSLCTHYLSILWQKYELLQRQICAFTLHHVIYNFQPISLSAMQLKYCHCDIPSSSKCFRWLSHWLLNISGSEHSPLAPSELWAGQTLKVLDCWLPGCPINLPNQHRLKKSIGVLSAPVAIATIGGHSNEAAVLSYVLFSAFKVLPFCWKEACFTAKNQQGINFLQRTNDGSAIAINALWFSYQGT